MNPKLLEIQVQNESVIFVISANDSTAARFAQFVTGELGVVPLYGRTPDGDFTFYFHTGK